jgi:mono/diheme cytochrome c family protein
MKKAALILVCGAFAILVSAQTTIKKVPAQYTEPGSGEQMYASYCASCHGVDARGNGPAAPALKIPPPNLTTLAARNGGKFPAIHVQQVIKGGGDMVSAHGSLDMPVWGPIFRAIDQNDSGPKLRLANLTRYLESIQGK